MDSKLLLKVRTVEEREKLSEELGVLLDSLYKEKGNGFNSALTTKIRYWVAELIKEEGGTNLENIENYLKTLLLNLDKLKVMSLTLAFEPTDTSIDKLIQTIRKDGTNEVILDFSYDSKIVGGAIIAFEGEYRDLSLKRLYEAEYEEKLEEIKKIVYSK